MKQDRRQAASPGLAEHRFPERRRHQLAALGANELGCLREQPNDMQRQEVRLVDDLVEPKRVGLVISRPFDQLAHLGDHGARQVAGCSQRQAAALDRLLQQDERVARYRRAGDLVGIEIIGDADCGRNGRRLLPQCPQTVEGEQRPGWLHPIEPLPHLRILQKVLCDHGSARHAELS